MKRLFVVLMFTVAGLAQAQRGGARSRPCIFDWERTSDSTHTSIQQTQTGKLITFWGGGVRGKCRGTGMVIASDSLEYSEDVAVLTLIGHARYTEDSTTITSNLMRYRQLDAQLFAEGAVRILMKNGSTVEADLIQYLRPQLPARSFSAADASGRTRLVMRDSLAVPDSQTTVITSDRLHMVRDSLFYAAGTVVITRPDLIGTSDSAETNKNRQTARLIGAKPQLKGRGARTFTIDGNILDIIGRETKIERLIARGKAVAVSDSLNLSADTLDIRTTGTLIDRVEAWGGDAHAPFPRGATSARAASSSRCPARSCRIFARMAWRALRQHQIPRSSRRNATGSKAIR